MTLAGHVRRAQAAWDDRLEQDVFGTGDPEVVAAAVEGHVRSHLGEPVEALFYEAGVGAVAGLVLADGRRVVVKVHRWNVTVDGLTAMQAVQAHLADAGLPMPRPLVPPTPLGSGLATVEEHLGGERADGRDPAIRRAMAVELHRLVEAARDLEVDLPRAVMLRPPGAPLWTEPHTVRFDFEATAAGAEWIDQLGAHARSRLDRVSRPDVIGHVDWRVQNLAFHGDELAAIYDSDSLGRAPEAVVVGVAAGGHCIDWEADVEDPPPTVDEMHAFVADYVTARGRPFEDDEWDALDAANLMMVSYGARCQHSDLTLQPELGDTSRIGWFRLLRERGERCFPAP